nr:hypothetical protein [Tanacetum cinerariifolium]
MREEDFAMWVWEQGNMGCWGKVNGIVPVGWRCTDPGKNHAQSPSQIDHQFCYECDDSLDDIFCQQCTCKSFGKGAHYGYNCPPKVSIISNLKPCHDQNVEEFPQTLPSFHPTCYFGDENSFAYDLTPNLVKDPPNVFNPPSQPSIYSYEFYENDAQYGHDCPPQVPINDSMIELPGTFQAWLQQKRDQVCQKIPFWYDDDEESSTPLRDIIIFELSPCITITPVLFTKDSPIMGDEHLDTILEKESDEFIKSSVENLVPNPNESEDERECDVPACDNFTTFSNLLFDADDDFSSSEDESFSEDIPKEIYSNPLFDEEIISIDYLLDEFAGKLILLKSIPPGIDEADCDLEEEIRLIKKLFDSLIEEIDLFLTLDESMPPSIENYDNDSERDMIILGEFLSNDSLSLLENESFHFDIPSSSRPSAKPPDDDDIEPNSEILTIKVVGNISEHFVLMPKLLTTQPSLTSNQEKSPHLLSHRGLKAF